MHQSPENPRSSGKLVCTFFIALSLVLFIGAGNRGGEEFEYELPSVSLSTLTDPPITIGDPIDIALTIYHRRKDRVLYPVDANHFLPFILHDMVIKRKKVAPRARKTLVIYTITAFQTGKIVLRPLRIQIGDEFLETASHKIQIISVLPKDIENHELKDIVPPYRARMKRVVLLLIALGICAAFGGFILISRYLIKPSHEKKTLVSVEPVLDPYDFSLKQLLDIRRAHEKNLANSKVVYSTISNSLKLFFGYLLSIHALEMTTNEIRRHMKRKKPSQLQPNRLLNILHQSDMVKFAKDKPSEKRIHEDIEESISMIKDTHKILTMTEHVGEEGSLDGI